MGKEKNSIEKELSEAAVKIVTEAEKLVRSEKNVDWYSAVESLLGSYKAMKNRMEDLSDYDFEPFGRSASISIAPPKGTSVKDFMDVRDEVIEERKKVYAKSLALFEEFDSVVKQYENAYEFKVIRMRYFGEDENGNDMPVGTAMSFEQIANALGINERTARNWRGKIVKSMAVVLGGLDGAIASQRSRQRAAEAK